MAARFQWHAENELPRLQRRHTREALQGAERLRNKPRVHETTRLLCDPGEERGSRLSVVRSGRGGSHIFRGRLFYFLIFSGVYSRFLLRAEEVVAE